MGDDARDPENPIPDGQLQSRRTPGADGRRFPIDGDIEEAQLIPPEQLESKEATLRLTLKSGPTLNLRTTEEVCRSLHRTLVGRYRQETLDLLVNDPASPLFHQR